MANINQRLNGLTPLSYLGDNAVQPPDFITKNRPPNATDSRNVYLGTIWLNTAGYPTVVPTISSFWILAALIGNQATWVQMSGGTVLSVNAGNNISITGTAINPIVNVAGTTIHDVQVGNALGSLTSIPNGVTGQVLTAQTGADPIWAAGAAGTVTTLHTDDGNNVTPTAGVINIHGTHGLNTTGTVGPNIVTVAINNAITLGDLANLGAGVAALNAQTGDITITANAGVGNLNLPVTTATGNAGVITQGGTGGANRFIHTFGTQNIFVGHLAGNFTNTASNCLGIGVTNFQVLTTGNDNVGIGNDSLPDVTTGQSNTAVGVSSLSALTTSSQNIAVGGGALASLLTGTGGNVAVGLEALFELLTGIDNVAVGTAAGTNYTGAESGNITIGVAFGTTGENNVTRIGFDNANALVQTKCFIDGIRGKTTDANDAIPVLVSSTGQLGTVSSSRNVKENINDMGHYSECLYKLRPVTFNYKKHSPQSVSVGLIAEEVYETAPHLVAHNDMGEIETVKYHDLVPMLLNELQKHKEILRKRDNVIEELLNRVRILEEQLL